MMCNFHVGQRIVLAKEYDDFDHIRAMLQGDVLPVTGVVYTVREIEPEPVDGLWYIRLVEIKNDPLPFDFERESAFNSARFRPVVERKTDISVFTAMLNTSKERAPA